MELKEFIALDLPPLLAAAFSALACALLGNYLLLRRLSLMGDAISHSVLPGIVLAFLLTSSRATLPVFLGAAAAGIFSALVIELVRRYGRVEPGAAMGVVFSIMFALGVLLIEQAAARSIDLDADCLLHGQLESLFWSPPQELAELLSFSTLALLPSEVITSFATLLVTIIFVVVLYKELKLATFDPALANALGFSSRFLHGLLMLLVACAVVASFRVVGSILVIAMIICPAATARLLTDRLATQLILSMLIAIVCCVLGYLLGALGPLWLGYQNSVSAAGMITVVAGVALSGSVVFAPRHGVLARSLRQWRLALSVLKEDILAFLYRAEELSAPNSQTAFPTPEISAVFGKTWLTSFAVRALQMEESVQRKNGRMALLEKGRNIAKGLIRSHRLWETYLVGKLGLPVDHVHQTAERLEHFTGPELQQEMARAQGTPKVDPHGREIPS